MRAKTFQNISCLWNWYTIVKRIQIFYSVSQQSHGFIVSRIFAVTPWSVKKGLLFYAYCGRSARRDVKFINSDDIPTTVLNVITPSASIMVNGFPRFWWDTRHDGRQDGACAQNIPAMLLYRVKLAARSSDNKGGSTSVMR